MIIGIAIFGLLMHSHQSNAATTASTIKEQYIVVLKDDVTDPKRVSESIARSNGIAKDHTYEDALKGFSAKIPKDKLDKVRNDPRIEFVEGDFMVTTQEFQTLPNGVDRIDADRNTKARIDGKDERIDADIAILDTGIDLDHPDLNVVSQRSFVKKIPTGNDDNGHGTHVAGIAAAIDNGFGVVGVAPGARLHSLKVLDSTGSGSVSQVIAGIDWITKHSELIDIANLSFSCSCHSKAMHKAVKKSIETGVVYIAAAGNDASDAQTFEPAAYTEVMAVSAIVDTDRKCGAKGRATVDGTDDSLAAFSNFGGAIDIAAPGVDILSTFKDGAYTVKSGTSMATPHVAGSVALYLDGRARDLNQDGQRNSEDVVIVTKMIISSAVKQDKACKIGSHNGNGGFDNDPDGSPEPLVFARKL